MTDHRMTIKAYINGEQVASFIDETVARIFAIHFTKKMTRIVELTNKSGMIGQYQNGLSTAEFQLHHNAWLTFGERTVHNA
jgi:hypothetical protein